MSSRRGDAARGDAGKGPAPSSPRRRVPVSPCPRVYPNSITLLPMPRILAIDFGEKRIGLATCDATGQVVAARRTVGRKSDAKAAAEIARFCAEEEVAEIVLGIPKSPDGAESPFAARIRSFGARLSARAGLPIRYH